MENDTDLRLLFTRLGIEQNARSRRRLNKCSLVFEINASCMQMLVWLNERGGKDGPRAQSVQRPCAVSQLASGAVRPKAKRRRAAQHAPQRMRVSCAPRWHIHLSHRCHHPVIILATILIDTTLIVCQRSPGSNNKKRDVRVNALLFFCCFLPLHTTTQPQTLSSLIPSMALHSSSFY
jgi:hypothetical protein